MWVGGVVGGCELGIGLMTTTVLAGLATVTALLAVLTILATSTTHSSVIATALTTRATNGILTILATTTHGGVVTTSGGSVHVFYIVPLDFFTQDCRSKSEK